MQLFAVLVIFTQLAINQCSAKRFAVKALLNLVASETDLIVYNTVYGTKCGNDLQKWVADLYEMEPWALKMVDANAKIFPGVLEGNIFHLGNFDECVSISQRVGNRLIEGQYCSVYIEPSGTSNFSFCNPKAVAQKLGLMDSDYDFYYKIATAMIGLCLPRSCSVRQLNSMSRFIEKEYEIPCRAVFRSSYCSYKDKPIYPYKCDVYVFIFFGLILFTALMSTCYDIYLTLCGHEQDVFTIFSFYTNTKRLLSTHCEMENLKCIYGAKVIITFWIIIGHSLVIRALSSNNLLYLVTDWQNTFESNFNVAYPVDTFFVISGLLVTYVKMEYSKKYNINLLMFYAYRIVRLMPPVIVMVLVYISVLKYCIDGPIWPFIVEKLGPNCYHRWLPTILFLTNYTPHGQRCLEQTWYLTVDTQMYIIAPLLFLMLKKWPAYAVKLLTSIIAFCISYTGSVIWYHNVKNCRLYFLNTEECQAIYFSTIPHAPCWLIGVLMGLYLHKNESKKTASNHQISTQIHVILMAISLFTLAFLVLMSGFLHSLQLNSLFFSVVFNSLSKLVWSLAVAYVLYSCCTGRGGVLNLLLTHPLFIILGKLIYSVFLVHFAIIMVHTANIRQSQKFSSFIAVFDFFGYFAITMFFSVLFFLMFEAPIYTYLKYLGQKTSKRERKNNTE